MLCSLDARDGSWQAEPPRHQENGCSGRGQVDERRKCPLPPWEKSAPFGCRCASAGAMAPAPLAAPLFPSCLQGWRGTCSLRSQLPSFSDPCAVHSALLVQGLGLTLVKVWSFFLEDVASVTSQCLSHSLEDVPFPSVQDAVLLPPGPCGFASLSSGHGHPLSR